jgi:peroxiredoxin
MFGVGDTAPDFTLPAVDDQSVSLDETLRGGHNVVLIFLRHLG